MMPAPKCWWWLRSPGTTTFGAAYVDDAGSVYYYGHGVRNHDDFVRPALNTSNLASFESSNFKFVNEDKLYPVKWTVQD